MPSLAAGLAALAACHELADGDRTAAARIHASRAEAALDRGDEAAALAAATTGVAYDPLVPRHLDLHLAAQVAAFVRSPGTASTDRLTTIDYYAETLLGRDAARGPLYRTARGYVALARGDAAGAAALFSEAVLEGPSSPTARAGHGIALARLGRPEEAAAAFEAALVSDPKNVLALAHLGRLARQQGDLARAAELLQRAIDLADAAPVRLDLADALTALGRVPEAGPHLRRAVATDPTHAEAHRRLGDWLVGNDDLDGAERAYLTALRNGGGASARFGLALIAFRRGHAAQAARAFEALLDQDDALATAAYEAGRAWEAAGDARAAARMYARFVASRAQVASERERADDARQRLEQLAASGAQPRRGGAIRPGPATPR